MAFLTSTLTRPELDFLNRVLDSDASDSNSTITLVDEDERICLYVVLFPEQPQWLAVEISRDLYDQLRTGCLYRFRRNKLRHGLQCIVLPFELSNLLNPLRDYHFDGVSLYELKRHTTCVLQANKVFSEAQLEKVEPALLVVESAVSCLISMKHARTHVELMAVMTAFFRSVTGKSVFGTSIKLIDELSSILSGTINLQSNDWVDVLEDFHNNIHRVKDSILGQKLVKVFNHLIAHTVYHKMGIEVDSVLFDKLERQKIRPTVWNVLSFSDAVFGLLLFLVRQGRHALMTGDINCMFVDGKVITEFLNTAALLRKQFEFLGNPEAVDIKLPLYLKQLEDTIFQGDMISRMTIDKMQKTLISSVLLELKMVQNRHRSVLAASSLRWCPVGVFLYGDAGVAKSFINQGLYYYYCSLRGYTKEQATVHCMNFKDEYMSGYKSHMLGIILDDVAQNAPNKIQGVDPTLAEIIAIFNNTGYVTNQAEAFDKGKIPMLAEWCGVTSNVADLNARLYYNNSYAILRRIPLRIEPVVKEAYRVPDTTRIDSSKIPEGDYPDCWTFKVSRAKQVGSHHGEYVFEQELPNYASLLKYMKVYYENHISNQEKFMNSIGKMGPVELCACGLPMNMCECDMDPDPINPFVLQSGSTEIIDEIMAEEKAATIIQIKRIRHRMIKKFNPKGLDLLYVQKFFDTNSTNHVSTVVENAGLMTPEEYTNELNNIELLFLKEYRIFCDKAPSIKSMLVAGVVLVDETTSESWLSFTPIKGGKRNFLQEHLKQIHKRLLGYVPLEWNTKQHACLETYIIERVPHFLAEGWTDADIVRGMFDYVEEFSELIPSEERALTAEIFQNLSKKEFTLGERLTRKVIGLYFEHNWVRNSTNWLFSHEWTRKQILSTIQNQVVSVDGGASVLAGSAQARDNRLGGKKPFVIVVVAVCTSAALISMIVLFIQYMNKNKSKIEYQKSDVLRQVGVYPKKREGEIENPWTVPERSVTSLDFMPKRITNINDFEASLIRNLLYCELRGVDGGRSYVLPTHALVLDSETLLVNYHAIEGANTLTVWLGSKVAKGVNPIVTIDLHPVMMHCIPQRDLCFVSTKALPSMFKDIRSNFIKQSFDGLYDAYYLTKESSGDVKRTAVFGMSRGIVKHTQDFNDIDADCYYGTPEKPTVAGDCGSVLIMNTGYGPAIVGFHFLYDAGRNISSAIRLTTDDLVHTEFYGRPVVQCGVLKVKAPLTEETKLFTDFYEEGNIMVHGGSTEFRSRNRSRVGKSEIGQYLIDNCETENLVITDRLVAPFMDSWRPQQTALREYIKPTHSFDEQLLIECGEQFSKYVISNLTEEDKEDIHPVNLDVAVNGFPGVTNIDAQKFSTSGGYGYPGSKRNYLEHIDSVLWQDKVEYYDDVENDIELMWIGYKMGVRQHPIFSSQLKDEPVSLKKWLLRKTRVFFMCPLTFLTCMRMITLGLSRVMMRKKHIFKTAVGLNCHSEEWEQLYNQCVLFGMDNWIAGDFVGFDKILSLLISNVVRDFFLSIFEWSGNFSDEELLAARTMFDDFTNATIDYFGTFITLLGGEVSGHQLTTFFNSAANVILHMYAYGKIYGIDSVEEFFIMVEIRVLGDDVYITVSSLREEYNHTSVQTEFAKVGIQYTMADKDSPSVPYINVEEVTFLKRTFSQHDELPLIVAPLEKDSIYKMLVYTVASKTVSPSEQLAQAMCSAAAESYYHGRDFFTRINRLIDSAPKSMSLQAQMLKFPRPTWDQLTDRFYRASPNIKALVEGRINSQNRPFAVIDCPASLSPSTENGRVELQAKRTWMMSKVPFQGCVRFVTKEMDKRSGDESLPVADNNRFSNQKNKAHDSNGSHERTVQPGIKRGSLSPFSLEEELVYKMCKKRRNKARMDAWGSTEFQSRKVYVGIYGEYFLQPKLQSEPTFESSIDDVPDTAEESVDTYQQQTTFANEPVGEMNDISTGFNKVGSHFQLRAHLGDFLKRPALIYQYRWQENGAPGYKVSFSPWRAFFTTPAIKNKLQGFNLMRANLHLKFLVNGSPFYYGKLGAFYKPIASQTESVPFLTVAANVAQIPISQRPHVWLDNQSTSNPEMILPFLYPTPYVETKLANNLTDLGTISLWQYAALRSANGVSTTGIDISVYAWAEDVELAGATARPVLQASKSYGKMAGKMIKSSIPGAEYIPDGQVGALASTVSSVASKLKSVPIVGAYATATEAAANMVGSVADFFGFTNVPNISDVSPVKQIPFQLASSQISEPVMKLSLQPKQEIAMGAEQFGDKGGDALKINELCGRESFLCGALWTTTNATDDILFSSMVTPALFEVVSGATGYVGHTPMSYFSQMFQYWRGSVIFRFKVVRSQYHRGRLNICWDIAATQLTGTPSIGDPSTMNVVIDLDESDEVEIEIPYIQARQFLQTYQMVALPTRVWDNTSTPPATVFADSNGAISVRVMNRLTAPEASSDVDLLVFVRAGSDFKLAAPIPIDPNWTHSFKETSVLQSEKKYVLGEEGDDDDVFKEVFGENIVSLRELMHRSSLSAIQVTEHGTLAGARIINIPLKHIPRPPGFYDNGWESFQNNVGVANPYNMTRMHPINWVSYCFIGHKGSVNITVNNVSLEGQTYLDHFSLERVPRANGLNAAARRLNYDSVSYVSVMSSAMIQYNKNTRTVDYGGASGQALLNTKTNTGLCVNLPYYANAGFALTDPYTQYSNGDTTTDGNNDWWYLRSRINGSQTPKSITTEIYYATGPDFDLVFFLNCPIVYFKDRNGA